MSLHGKIIAWFVCFAAVTLTVLGVGDYVQSTGALRGVLESQASSLARQSASELERRYSQLESELLALGYAVAAGHLDTEVPDRYESVRVLAGDSVIWGRLAPETASASPCSVGTLAFDVPVRIAHGSTHSVQAVISTARFIDGLSFVQARLGDGGETTLSRQADSSLVFDVSCAAGMRRRDRGALVAMAPVQGPDWLVTVSVDYVEFAAPFTIARVKYLGLVLCVLLMALLMVLRALRHDMGRFAAISRAADNIGHGRFDVWLPPPTNDQIGRLSLALGRMVSRLSTSMNQMEVARAMAAVGELATYLSHEIRNPLSSIRLNLQMLRRDLRTGEVPEDGEELVGLCLTELQRLDDVVRTVLDVGRKPTGVVQALADVHVVIQETLQVTQPKLRAHGVEVRTHLLATTTEAAVDPAQLKSTLLNLLLNSVDALADSETRQITIVTESHDGAEDGAIELRVCDTGPGVPPHLRERIFEPFFTTKPNGNGVGLATAMRMAQECGGSLRCVPPSEWQGGAEFLLELPLSGRPRRSNRSDERVAAGIA